MKIRNLVLALALTLGPHATYYTGAASNAIVMAANQAQMPVLVPGGCTDEIKEVLKQEQEREGMQVHACMTKETRYKFLADWIVIRHKGVASPGDILEWLGDVTVNPFMIAFLALAFRHILFEKRDRD